MFEDKPEVLIPEPPSPIAMQKKMKDEVPTMADNSTMRVCLPAAPNPLQSVQE